MKQSWTLTKEELELAIVQYIRRKLGDQGDDVPTGGTVVSHFMGGGAEYVIDLPDRSEAQE